MGSKCPVYITERQAALTASVLKIKKKEEEDFIFGTISEMQKKKKVTSPPWLAALSGIFTPQALNCVRQKCDIMIIRCAHARQGDD